MENATNVVARVRTTAVGVLEPCRRFRQFRRGSRAPANSRRWHVSVLYVTWRRGGRYRMSFDD